MKKDCKLDIRVGKEHLAILKKVAKREKVSQGEIIRKLIEGLK